LINYVIRYAVIERTYLTALASGGPPIVVVLLVSITLPQVHNFLIWYQDVMEVVILQIHLNTVLLGV